jgi:hypothetical protein
MRLKHCRTTRTRESGAERARSAEGREKRRKDREAGGMARHEWESQLQYKNLPKG